MEIFPTNDFLNGSCIICWILISIPSICDADNSPAVCTQINMNFNIQSYCQKRTLIVKHCVMFIDNGWYNYTGVVRETLCSYKCKAWIQACEQGKTIMNTC